MNGNRTYPAFPTSWLVFPLVVGLYIWLYAPYGIDNNDTGFVLGLAHQVSLGARLYEHIVYVRPPVTPILHSFVFSWPFSFAPVLVDRIFVFLQMALYSALSAVLAKRCFSWSDSFTSVAAALAFVFSAHVFPPMAWHTIDGIFFSVLALGSMMAGLQGHRGFLVLSAWFGILAAGSKQPFLLVPVMLLFMLIFMERRWRPVAIYALSLLGSVLLFSLILERFGSSLLFWAAISSQTTARDLLFAGFENYARSLSHEGCRYGAWPLLAILPLSLFRSSACRWAPGAALIGAVGMFLACLALFYRASADSFQPLELFNSLFVATLFYSLVMLAKSRADSWLLLVAMHAIAWCASISWGYLTPVLYSAPSVLTVAAVLEPCCRRSGGFRMAALTVFPLALAVFWQGHRLFYSLEGPVRRTGMTADMGGISPALRGVRGTPEQYRLYVELMRLVGRAGSRPYAVLPDITFAHLLSGTPNPLGIDWVLNTEVGSYRKEVGRRLDSEVDYAIVYRKASPRPDLPGKFGSDATMQVINGWRLQESTDNFSLYVNPAKVPKE
ncbi:MAG: hypothetical protein HGB04_04380 [Chlorobiaceae bacterium]|nr:hypothetical protein [Chlorobiaceae bacterium]